MHNLDVRRAKRILVGQAVATLIVSVGGMMFGPREGLFALVGGATALCANALFALWVFGSYRADEPGKLVGKFFGGEIAKLGFVALGFAATIAWMKPISPVALFGAFLVVQILPPLLANRIAG